MTDTPFLSPAEVSKALGVSISTIKRWVDQGVLPARKTAGGHRKLLRADVLRLVRDGSLPHVDLTLLGLPARFGAADTETLCRRLFDCLMKGDMAQTRSIIHGAYAAGLPLERLADELIAPAMLRMGHQWEEGRIDVMHEHRGTLLCNAALHELRPALETNADQNRPIAVGGNPEGDHSFLASLLIQLMLLDAGWDPVNLGPNTPLASFRIAMSELKPRLLWLSASHLSDPHKFLGEYREIYNDARAAGIAVAVGGQALQNSMPGVLPATCYGGSLTDLAKFARTLYSRPELPKRGRPRQAPAAGGQPGQR